MTYACTVFCVLLALLASSLPPAVLPAEHLGQAQAVLIGTGIVVGVAYTWRALQRVFLNDAPVTEPVEDHAPYAPITWAEWAGVLLLTGTSLLVGLMPRLLLDVIAPAVQALPHILVAGGRG